MVSEENNILTLQPSLDRNLQQSLGNNPLQSLVVLSIYFLLSYYSPKVKDHSMEKNLCVVGFLPGIFHLEILWRGHPATSSLVNNS
jgi:hypothetical protein